jgi:hypothetical protein
MNKKDALSNLRKIEVYALSKAKDAMTRYELHLAFQNLYNFVNPINDEAKKR